MELYFLSKSENSLDLDDYDLENVSVESPFLKVLYVESDPLARPRHLVTEYYNSNGDLVFAVKK